MRVVTKYMCIFSKQKQPVAIIYVVFLTSILRKLAYGS